MLTSRSLHALLHTLLVGTLALTVVGASPAEARDWFVRAGATDGDGSLARPRLVQQAKSYSSGTPDQTYVIKGVVRSARQLLVETVERAD